MLNPYWKRVYSLQDFKEWEKMEAHTPPFYDFSFEIINKLLAKYFRTKNGYELGPTKNWYQRKEILGRTMKELEFAIANDEEKQTKNWNKNQERDESLDAQLEREKGMYESKISKREAAMNRVSQRDMPIATPIFDIASAPTAVEAIKSGIKAPVIGAQVSTLGGPERASIMIVVGLEPKESWVNGIFENSKYARFRLDRNGVMESFVNNTGTKFRKTRAKSIEDVIAKLNAFIAATKSEIEDAMSRAKAAIERGDGIAHDVAAEHGQMFDNVKHMKWFVEAVAEEMN